jgi:putative hydrolase of the HAD superfamily
MGIAKPDPRFFQYILDKENLNHKWVVFIDDIWENILAGRNMGIRSIHFVNANLLKKDLEKIY